MFSYNKTNQWLQSLDSVERDKLLREARRSGRDHREKFKKRCEEIKNRRKAQLLEKEAATRRRREVIY